MRAAKARGDETLWTLVKTGSVARAVTCTTIGGFGIELRVIVNGVLRQSAVYFEVTELSAGADEKRRQLLEQGWRDVPPNRVGELNDRRHLRS